jgi:hypothetical protein
VAAEIGQPVEGLLDPAGVAVIRPRDGLHEGDVFRGACAARLGRGP